VRAGAEGSSDPKHHTQTPPKKCPRTRGANVNVLNDKEDVGINRQPTRPTEAQRRAAGDGLGVAHAAFQL
jgi:hypothetical protein